MSAAVQRWIPRGILVAPPRETNRSHAALPFSLPVGENLYQVFFSSRDEHSRSRIFSIEIQRKNGTFVQKRGAKMELDLGSLGAFDDSGVTMASIIEFKKARYLYYTGWSLGKTVPFYFAIGLAISERGRPFRRVSEAPVIGRTPIDPFLAASPCILQDRGRLKMWYVSGTRWEKSRRDEVTHYYNIRYAESSDGVQWQSAERPCVTYANSKENSFGRPSVLKMGKEFWMWYSFRGDHYRLGFAKSKDGRKWTRQDSAIHVPRSKFDTQMQEYPHVFKDKNRFVMLYNGDGFGKTGIAWAEMGLTQ